MTGTLFQCYIHKSSGPFIRAISCPIVRGTKCCPKFTHRFLLLSRDDASIWLGAKCCPINRTTNRLCERSLTLPLSLPHLLPFAMCRGCDYGRLLGSICTSPGHFLEQASIIVRRLACPCEIYFHKKLFHA